MKIFRRNNFVMYSLMLFFTQIQGLDAAVITTNSYQEDPNKYWFKWELTWDGSLPASDTTVIAPNHQFWDPAVGLFDVQNDNLHNDLLLQSEHLEGPHPLDVNPSDGVEIWVDNINLLASTTNSWVRIQQASATHRHTPDDHKDLYDLFYRKALGPAVTFRIQAVHVPEPTTVGLMLVGILLICFRSWKVFKPSILVEPTRMSN